MFRFFKQNISRSPYQSLAAVFVVSLAFFLLSIFFLLGVASQEVLRFFESKPQVTAFLKDEAKIQEVELLKTKVEATGKIKKVLYISKDEALKIYREQNKDKPLLLEMVTAKILPASLEISTKDLSSLKEIANVLKREAIIEDVIFQEDVVTSLANWVAALRNFELIIAIFLLLVAFFTILIVVGMKISQRREDIEIYKLLGASPWYICSPLYLEGIFYGVVSAFIAWGLSYLIILYSTPFWLNFLSGIVTFPVSFLFMLELLGGLLLLGVIVGLLSSVWAVSRFLRFFR